MKQQPPIQSLYPRGVDRPIIIETSDWNWLADKMDLSKPLYAVNNVQTPRRCRGQGLARGAMRQMLADADLNHVTLVLAATPDPGYEWVHEWYRRLGFAPLEDGTTMVRRPSALNVISNLARQTSP